MCRGGLDSSGGGGGAATPGLGVPGTGYAAATAARQRAKPEAAGTAAAWAASGAACAGGQGAAAAALLSHPLLDWEDCQSGGLEGGAMAHGVGAGAAAVRSACLHERFRLSHRVHAWGVRVPRHGPGWGAAGCAQGLRCCRAAMNHDSERCLGLSG